ncbi:unnamed protein product [Colletotrichum noveboracense]|uniref:Uncharacterized protein n=1 Tax=Colletotrichum noveboracense TaxID=2664923 RepID=A0A9W4RM21_9PEZI|nr:unnamed protein product [Colletotrichum noveboracense]
MWMITGSRVHFFIPSQRPGNRAHDGATGETMHAAQHQSHPHVRPSQNQRAPSDVEVIGRGAQEKREEEPEGGLGQEARFRRHP